jgi:exosortase
MLAVSALGWFLFRQLALEWSINPQYSYGWVVPFLTVYLVAERWRNRPAPGTPIERPAWAVALLVLLGVIRLAQEANPDWRLLSWLASLSVVGLLWLGFAAMGGRSWWRHFSFATAFLLVATPWPTPLENIFVQALMQNVAAIGVEALNWLGIAAAQEGNLIRLTGGTLGIDEACSGVRSFQATIMAALFLGELHRLSWTRRAALLAAGILLSLGLNLARAVGLAIAAGKEGLPAIQRWHDPAGYILLAITFFGLLLLARILGEGFKPSRKQIPPPPVVDDVRSPSPSKPMAPKPSSVGSYENCSFPPSAMRWPLRGYILIIIALAASELGTRAWYWAHEKNQPVQVRWKIDWPKDIPAFRLVAIPDATRLVLRYNDGESAQWDRPDGSRWRIFFLSWKPGRAAASLARNHRPESCLPSTGFEFVQSRGVKILRASGIDLPIERLEFKHAGQRWHVYYCLWEDRAPRADGGPLALSRENRLRAIAEGRRHLGQRVLEVVIAGIDSPERADAEFESTAAKWITVLPP